MKANNNFNIQRCRGRLKENVLGAVLGLDAENIMECTSLRNVECKPLGVTFLMLYIIMLLLLLSTSNRITIFNVQCSKKAPRIKMVGEPLPSTPTIGKVTDDDDANDTNKNLGKTMTLQRFLATCSSVVHSSTELSTACDIFET